MRVLLVIPARHGARRYPGKPLVALTGPGGRRASLIEHCWHAARAVPGIARIVIATDDARIEAHAEGFGAEVVMTSADCANGTERCAEALARLGGGYDLVVNLQGDAPLTPPWFVTALIDALSAHPAAEVATPVLRCDAVALADLRGDRQAGRVGATTAVFGAEGTALYFSREVLPWQDPGRPAAAPVFHHVGVYAYRPSALAAYALWPQGPLERAEGLEQLRFMERGHRVLCTEVEARGVRFWEVNNPEDVARIEEICAAGRDAASLPPEA
ncbi:3-deoxy-manno-octulosonate cytidylyltransferase [Profundibacterium mesophilum]|uniref:CMP-2-keto-3-deoxyoctulaosonic acid synthetase n=1 Tax=Profundibacterium mesophilum KAUST100406-0324 TaxID=1037889 RepID=A0A921TD36_9RHOB|nr:manno-octulosonate cytidylyltransferase [Profundibacterium mesophilum]KAF0676378.1 CMP-2-keto-3-deoxyoctulaosonic acid synthetase [Profundibacterium mesophilum KAUST100406-0324]